MNALLVNGRALMLNGSWRSYNSSEALMLLMRTYFGHLVFPLTAREPRSPEDLAVCDRFGTYRRECA